MNQDTDYDLSIAIRSYKLREAKLDLDTAEIRQRLLMQQFRPCRLYPVTIHHDGVRWVCTYGVYANEFFEAENGVVAYGMSPEEAMQNFDAMWLGNNELEEDEEEDED